MTYGPWGGGGAWQYYTVKLELVSWGFGIGRLLGFGIRIEIEGVGVELRGLLEGRICVIMRMLEAFAVHVP